MGKVAPKNKEVEQQRKNPNTIAALLATLTAAIGLLKSLVDFFGR
jgi:hypothetical protein